MGDAIKREWTLEGIPFSSIVKMYKHHSMEKDPDDYLYMTKIEVSEYKRIHGPSSPINNAKLFPSGKDKYIIVPYDKSVPIARKRIIDGHHVMTIAQMKALLQYITKDQIVPRDINYMASGPLSFIVFILTKIVLTSGEKKGKCMLEADLDSYTANEKLFIEELVFLVKHLRYAPASRIISIFENIDIVYTNSKLEERRDELFKLLKAGDWEKFRNEKIMDFFELVDKEMGEKYPSVYSMLTENETTLKNKKVTKADVKKVRTNLLSFLTNHLNMTDITEDNMITELTRINPSKCTVICEDDVVCGEPFADYIWEDADKFIHINKGYCYTATFIASMIAGKRGVMDLNGLFLYQTDIKNITKFLGHYYGTTYPEELSDIMIYFQGYEEWEKNVIKTNFKIDGSVSVVAFDASDKSLWTEDTLTKFFAFMINDYQKLSQVASSINVILKSSNMIMEMIGLMGWIMISDDVSVMENTGSKFEISQYCLGQFLNFVETLDDKTKAEFKQMTFGDDNMERILKDIPSTCIHGIGFRMINFYINGYIACKNYLETLTAAMDEEAEIKKEMFVPTKLKDIANYGGKNGEEWNKATTEEIELSYYNVDEDDQKDYIKSFFSLAPFIIPTSDVDHPYAIYIPSEHKLSTSTSSTFVINPLNRIYHTALYVPHKKAFRWFGFVYQEVYEKELRFGTEGFKDNDLWLPNPTKNPMVFVLSRSLPNHKFAYYEKILLPNKSMNGGISYMYDIIRNRKAVFTAYLQHMSHVIKRTEAASYIVDDMFGEIIPPRLTVCMSDFFNQVEKDLPKKSININSAMAYPYKKHVDRDVVGVFNERDEDITDVHQYCSIIKRLLLKENTSSFPWSDITNLMRLLGYYYVIDEVVKVDVNKYKGSGFAFNNLVAKVENITLSNMLPTINSVFKFINDKNMSSANVNVAKEMLSAIIRRFRAFAIFSQGFITALKKTNKTLPFPKTVLSNKTDEALLKLLAWKGFTASNFSDIARVLIDDFYSIFNPEYNKQIPLSAPLDISEITNELQLLVHINSKMPSLSDAGSDLSRLNITSQLPKFVRYYNVIDKTLGENYIQYKEEDFKIKDGDYQGGIMEKYVYTAKLLTLENLQTKVAGCFLLNEIINKYLNPDTFDAEDAKLIQAYNTLNIPVEHRQVRDVDEFIKNVLTAHVLRAVNPITACGAIFDAFVY